MIEESVVQGVEIAIPSPAQWVLDKLNGAGHSAYVVGGCVRDSLLGLEPHDWDICTSARPEQVIDVFGAERVIPTGLKHGTVTVRENGESFEVTTFRVDGPYSDGRRPDSVRFSDDLIEDLMRRDFTMNAMAYHPAEGLIDPFGGREDIDSRLLRCVGDAYARFSEDALRILRAIRFSAVYGFRIGSYTRYAMATEARMLGGIAKERVGVEVRKLLAGRYAAAVIRENIAVLNVIIPYLQDILNCSQNNSYHYANVFEHTMDAMAASWREEVFPAEWADEYVRAALFFHDFGKAAVKTCDEQGYEHFYGHPKVSAERVDEILRGLRMPNEYRRTVVQLVENHDATLYPSLPSARRWLLRLGEEQLRRLMKMQECDAAAHVASVHKKRFADLKTFSDCVDMVLTEASAFSLKRLVISGKDLLTIGYTQGPEIGKTLRSLLEDVVEGKLKNEKEALLSAAAGMR